MLIGSGALLQLEYGVHFFFSPPICVCVCDPSLQIDLNRLKSLFFQKYIKYIIVILSAVSHFIRVPIFHLAVDSK